MALVRRDNLAGRTAVGRASIPLRTAPPTGLAGAPVVPGPDPVASSATTALPVQPGGAAAAVPSQPTSWWAIVGAFGLLIAGGLVSWAIWRFGRTPQPLRVQDATTVFAVLFAFATAVERLLEPFARF